jgi:hypothetical protein
MNEPQVPIVLELAPLPREQLGPFLILGVGKDADSEQIEASWAQRVIGARKNQVSVPLEDINWAREVINDPQRRQRADATSLTLDTADGVLRQLAERYSVGRPPQWKPFDAEKPLADHTPAVEVPLTDDVRAALTVPDMPTDLPAALRLLEQMAQEPIDPWSLSLPSDPSHAS